MNNIVLFVLTGLTLCFSGPAIISAKENNIGESYDQFLSSLYNSDYYNSKTNQTLGKLPAPYVPGHKPSARQPFINLCDCDALRCSCCAGVRIYGLALDRRVCANLLYDPQNSLIDMELKLNEINLYKNKFSTEEQNICVPVLPVAVIRSVQFCIKLYDITVVDQRLHACLNMITMISELPFVTLQFNCMEMGFDGVGISRPGEVAQPNLPIVTNSSNIVVTAPPQHNQEDSDVYNPVPDNKQ